MKKYDLVYILSDGSTLQMCEGDSAEKVGAAIANLMIAEKGIQHYVRIFDNNMFYLTEAPLKNWKDRIWFFVFGFFMAPVVALVAASIF